MKKMVVTLALALAFSYNVSPIETIAAESTEYIFTDLKGGSVYDFGVQAIAEDFSRHSKVVYLNNFQLAEPKEPVVPEDPKEPETPVDPEEPKEPDSPVEPEQPTIDPQTVPQVTQVKTSYAYIAVSYKVEKLAGSNPEHGVCFSENGTPSVNDIKVLGPQLPANKEILQVVPNAYLEDGKEYYMSVFVKNGNDYIYSDPQTVKLDAQPDAVSLKWTKENYSLEGVEVYKTTSQINSRNFNAWYAIADPSVVDFKVLYPETVGSKKTVAAQAEAAGNCLALINGAIYGNYNIGVTADGKIILFICDGRIDASQGAYIKELGPIMKSLGCVHAMNLDGGGSTGMWVKGSGMINYKDGSWRAVKSTLGFFAK